METVEYSIVIDILYCGNVDNMHKEIELFLNEMCTLTCISAFLEFYVINLDCILRKYINFTILTGIVNQKVQRYADVIKISYNVQIFQP